MATIATTTNSTPFIYPSTTLVDRDPNNGYLYCLVKVSTANTYTLYRSTNNGSSWSSLMSVTRANIQEIGSIYIHPEGWVYWCYRTNESSQDRIYFRRGNPATAWWQDELLVANPANGGVAGAVHTGLDLVVVRHQTNGHYVAVACGLTVGAQHGLQVYGVYINAVDGIPAVNHGIISGTRQWLHTGSGRITPSADLEHNGSNKGYGSNVPNAWIGYGRDSLRLVKLAWNSAGWSGPSSPVVVDSSISAQDSISARWDGTRFLMCVPTDDTVVVQERNQANSATTNRTSEIHPAGNVRNVAISYDAESGDFRLFAVGTSSTVLYYIDYVRASSTWSTWTQVLATAVLGATGNNHGVRRSTYGNARYDVYTAHSGSPNTLTHTQQSISYAPDTPTWQNTAQGVAAEVAQVLDLDWAFSDPDPDDTQSAYALSRQVGSGALAYWRASDSTWQATEQKNTSGTSYLQLAAGWAAASDDPHTYKVKVWDAADVASGYSAGLVFVPSTKVNPAITSPTFGSAITTDTVPLTWTVAEQTARRVTLHQADRDTFTRTVASGWGTSDTGAVWTTSGGSASDYSTNGSGGLISLPAVNASRRTVTGSLVDVEVVGTVSVSAVATGAAIRVALMMRAVDASTDHYRAQVAFDTAGVMVLSVVVRAAASDTTLATHTLADTYSAGTAVKIRCRVVGSTLQAKAWLAANTEPGGWQITVADSTFTTAAPVGVRGVLATGNSNTLPVTVTVDNMVWADLGEADYESWWRTSTSTTLTPPTVLADLTTWWATVRTKNAEGLESDPAGTMFTVDYVEPAVPTLTATPDPGRGWIRVDVNNPAPSGGQPEVASQEVWRRTVGDTDDGIRLATGVASGGTHHDRYAVSGTAYEYRARAVGVNGTSIYSAWTA